jgi:type II secretory pathway component PulM
MLPFEILFLLTGVLILIYLAFFSPKFDRFCRKIFRMNNDSADAIATQVDNIEAARKSAVAAKSAREKVLADERAKLDKIQVK